jgi:hypothetical protein
MLAKRRHTDLSLSRVSRFGGQEAISDEELRELPEHERAEWESADVGGFEGYS